MIFHIYIESHRFFWTWRVRDTSKGSLPNGRVGNGWSFSEGAAKRSAEHMARRAARSLSKKKDYGYDYEVAS